MQILFPQQLKKYRTKANLSQEEIAGKLYVSRQAVSRWEAGDATPDLTNIIKLAEIFDCSLDSLILGIEPAQAQEHVDNSEFVFDPRKGKYVRRRGTNFWDFLAGYWWVFIPLGGIVIGILNALVNAFH
ncbi:XRE family transcriptional regulator [Ligilactobacillus salitolerans]|uniref:XRE family transcriptional regulator n=1 Tax=Ligilactobacillus salitolerans TaxID=1808352 RepID=A0A401IUW1_9LACO|nr:helix-turn-helix transcriptional regulator [Ligilactobacillus salitolerans]GBG95306.1 XRE family transcriptional regulator [Ligilactobacillus salitolerans]